jgi:hypothetical protein
MSLASWKREFYRTPPRKVSKAYALKHSLKKWIGLLPKNRTKHKVTLRHGTLSDNNNSWLDIDAISCALCYHFEGDCKACPLGSCKSEYEKMENNKGVVPMINLLKRAVTKNGKK